MSSAKLFKDGERPRKPMRPWVWFSWLAGAVLVALALMVWVVLLLHQSLRSAQQPILELGVVGDMFGAATALFSGLAFAGLIVVLVFDMRERERDLSDRLESRRPVLTVRFDDGQSDAQVAQVTVSSAMPESGRGVDLRLDILVPLLSLADVALTPAIELAIVSEGSVIWTCQREIGLPINSGSSYVLQFVAQFHGGAGADFLRQMSAGSGPRLRATVEYDSVSGVRWQTVVEAELRVSPGDEGPTAQVLSGAGYVGKHIFSPESEASVKSVPSGRRAAEMQSPQRVASSLKTDLSVDASTWRHSRSAVN